MEIYWDDFVIGDSASKHSTTISAAYFTINNLPYEFQSRRDSIMPLLLAKKEELDLVVVDPNVSKDPKAPKHQLLENFFRPLIDDLKRLANPTDLGLK